MGVVNCGRPRLLLRQHEKEGLLLSAETSPGEMCVKAENENGRERACDTTRIDCMSLLPQCSY